MAVEVNKRKRKHPEGEADAVEAVPQKQVRTSSSNEKDNDGDVLQDFALKTTTTNDEQRSDGGGQKKKKKKAVKVPKTFSMLEFRSKLRGNNFITELRQFLQLSCKRPQILSKYLEKRGKPLELAESLERIDKTNIWHVSYICEALQLVLLEIQSNKCDLMESAVYASRYFLKSHAGIVNMLLESSASVHKRVALKLLTVMVCIEPALGRLILSTYQLLSNTNEIHQFLEHNREEDKEKEKEKESVQGNTNNNNESTTTSSSSSSSNSETVRECYIHFVLAYLVDGNTLLIRNILDKGGIVQSVIDGLMYDDVTTVCMVLSTIQKYILECPEISKTKKIHVFDVNCCKTLLRLYEWKGPKTKKEIFYPQRRKEKREDEEFAKDQFMSEEQQQVAKAVHKLLITLLTSRKYGIAFDTGRKHLRYKRNNIQSQILPAIYRPWWWSLKTELVLKILENCPDLLRNAVRHYSSLANPFRSGQKFYVICSQFLKKIIDTCHPKFLEKIPGLLDNFTLTDFSYWIKDVCLPVECLVHIKGGKLLQHRNFDFRFVTTQLLLTMFQQYTNYMKVINRRELKKKCTGSSDEASATNSLRKFKFDILNHLLTNFPTIEDILGSLNMSIDMKHDSSVDVLAHLNVVLDLVLAICQENRTFVNKTSVILDYLELLRPLYALDDNDNDDNKLLIEQEHKINDEQMIHLKLEMKAIKTILLLFPKALEPQRDRFQSVLKSFIKAFVYGNREISSEAGMLLRSIFKNTGIFESSELEIDMWLELLRISDNRTINVIQQVFNEVFKVTSVKVEMPKTNVEKNLKNPVDRMNLHQLFTQIEKGLVLEAYVEPLSISKLMPLIFKGVHIDEPLDQYLEMVCLMIFHYYPKPEDVLQFYETQFKDLSPYMRSWLSNNKNNNNGSSSVASSRQIPTKYLDYLPEMKNVAEFIFIKESSVKTIFCRAIIDDDDDDGMITKRKDAFSVKFKDHNDHYTLMENIQSERYFILVIQHVLFQIIQLYRMHELNRSQAERGAQFIIDCFQLIINLMNSSSSSSNEEHEEDEEPGRIFSQAMIKHYDDDDNDHDNDEKRSFAHHLQREEGIVQQLLKYIYGIRLNFIEGGGQYLLQVNKNNLSYLYFVRRLTDYCGKLPGFTEFANNFKHKLIKTIAISISQRGGGDDDDDVLEIINRGRKQQTNEQLQEFIEVLKVFQLNREHCLEILQLLMENLTAADYLKRDESSNQMKTTIFYQFLVFALKRLVELNVPVKCHDFITYFYSIYTKWYQEISEREDGDGDNDLNLEELDEVCYRFLTINHQYLSQINKEFLATFFFTNRRLSKISIRWLTLICERTNHLNEEVLMNLPKNLDKRELTYPLLNVCFRKQLSLPESLLKEIYQSYRNGFMRIVEKPHKAAQIYKENMECTLKLIDLCMPITECRDFCCNKQWKFDTIELPQIRTIYQIYKKAYHHYLNGGGGGEEEEEQQQLIFVNFIQLQIQMFCHDLKSIKIDLQKWEMMAYFLQEWFEINRHQISTDQQQQQHYTKILKSNYWMQFCKGCLKMAMKMTTTTSIMMGEEAKEEEEDEYMMNIDKKNGFLLNVMAYLCDQLYSDYNEDQLETTEQFFKEPGQLFEMVTTHSKYQSIVLNTTNIQKNTCLKTQIMHLLLVLAKKCPSALHEDQIPYILGSYQGLLTDCDRYTLALLNLYELYDCGLEKYKPFIWGESAIAFYSLRASAEDKSKLKQQETSIEQVMALVDRQVCLYTLDNFPIWRRLNCLEQLPEHNFCNPLTRGWNFGSNNLEKRLEMETDHHHHQNLINCCDSMDLRLCPKRDQIYEQCYDPAFFVPLMSMCFAPESCPHPARPVQNGLLALMFAALSSQDKEMRLAAGCVQIRYRQHFESGKFFEKPLWIQIYENLQAGLNDLRLSWQQQQHRKGGGGGGFGIPRVPYISGLFVAKSINLTTDPSHLLYKPLTMYLRLKSSFNFQCIPEFNVLFYSTEVEHQQYRQFILNVIRHGIKCSADLFLLVTTNTFKVLMGFYGSSVSNLEHNLLILSIFSTCVKIPASSKIMIENVGILPWLLSIIIGVEFYEFDIIEGLISIINNLWYALKASEKDFYNYVHLQKEIHRLIVRLLPSLSSRISVASFAKLMNILVKTSGASITTSDHHQWTIISKEQLSLIIDCAEIHFGGTLIVPIRSIFLHGGEGALEHQDYCRNLHEEGVDLMHSMALSSLRKYVLYWRTRRQTPLEIS